MKLSDMLAPSGAPSRASRRWTFATVAALITWAGVLWPLHDALPMWVEGMPAYLDQVLGVLRRACTPPVNTLAIAGRDIPLQIDAYQGPLMSYLDVPIVRAWLRGATDDLYLYRYKGIVLLVATGLLLYFLLRRLAAPSIAALATLVFVTLPANAVTAISDLQYHVPLLTAVVGIVFAAVKYAETQRSIWLFTTAFAAGLAMLTRAEALIWTMVGATVWLGLARRPQLVAWWRATPRKAVLLLGAAAAFIIGAAPIVAMNVAYPSYGLVHFLFVKVPSAAIGGDGLLAALGARVWQFASFILLNRLGLFDADVPHVGFAVLAIACIVALTLAALRERRWPFALVALAVVLPLSMVATRGPREIHLLPLLIPVVAIIAQACGRLQPRAGIAVLGTTIIANLIVGAMVLADWQALRNRKVETMVTHSCPACLASALERHAGALFEFTNIGLYQQALWASRARTCGKDLSYWGDDVGFATAIARLVDGGGGRFVFVGYPPARESAMGPLALRRSAALKAALSASGAAFHEETVAGPDARPYYLLSVVEELPSRLRIESAGVNPPADGRITGWIVGRGFRRSDQVTVDGIAQTPAYGGDRLVTFSIDAHAMSKGTVEVEVIGTEDRARSGELTITRP